MAGNTVQIKFEAVSNFSNVINNVKQIQNALRSIKLPDKVGDRLEKNINGVVLSMEKLQQQSKRGFTKPGDVTAYEKELQKADTMLNKIVKDLGSLSGKDLLKLNIDTTQITNLKRQVSEVKKEMASGIKGAMLDPSNNLKGAFAGMDQILGKGSKTKAIYDSLVASINKGNFSNAEAQWEKLTQYMNRYNSQKLDTAQWKAMKTTMTAALSAGTTEAQRFLPILNKLDKEIQDAVNVEQGNIESTIRGAGDAAQSTATQFSTLRQKEDEAANGILSMNQQMSQLKSQANYFFSLQNMFQLLKRGVQDAFQTVKDLDKAMTETAVVTDFNVGDMWKALPEYTELANKLGATAQGAYETMTLYYQQGLNKEQAFGLGEETMKMARIAGLDYAETTNMMTAALRGFNMELDNISAKRINDVYSNLAAKTASDTRELGEAMERTASIAHSANMSFESTTAFLANMIETTREAPENLGTAMKTIVARFQELKENPYEISEVEGEEVNFNRIDKALKSIGVTLIDNKDKFRDLDDVFMDISEKWDGLSQTQQRYIATISAGSRQQSRFIAMVGNYKRVSELIEAANNSSGASNVQFAKTLDSMEAKLNKLKNAWELFLMGITNNSVLKNAIDFGTKAISVINDIIEKISGGNGLVKSILSIGTAFAGLKIGGKLVNLFLGGVGNLIDPKGKGKGFLGGGLTGRRQTATNANATAINKPIVSVLNRIYSVVSQGFKTTAAKEGNDGARASAGEFAKINRSFMDSIQRGTSVGGMIDKLQQVDPSQQKTMMSSIPNITSNLRQQFLQQFSGIDLGPAGTKAIQSFWKTLMADVKSGATSWAKALELAFNPQAVGQEIGGKTNQAIETALANNKAGANGSPMARIRKTSPELEKGQGTPIQANFSKFDAGISKVGRGLGNASQALMGFGMLADQIFPGMGSMVNSLGMALGGLGSTFTSIAGALGPVGLAIAGVGTVIGGVVIALNKANKEAIKETRDSANKVVTNYEKTTKEVEKNLNTLEEYRDNFSKLSQGVDKNGLNVSLGTEEYADYKKIVNELVSMNPALIKGYNAEGQAIIDNNKALEETIKLQKEKQKQATEEYTSTESLQKLIDARDTYDRFIRNSGPIGQTGASNFKVKFDAGLTGTKGAAQVSARTYQETKQNRNQRAEYYQQYIDKLQEIASSDSELAAELESTIEGFGINDWENLDEEAIEIFENQSANIESAVNQVQRSKSVDSENITAASEALAKATKESEKYKASYEKVFNALQAYAGQQGFSSELEGDVAIFFNNALDNIAADINLSGENAASEMQKAVSDVGRKFTDAQNNVHEIMDSSITKAQDEYSKTLDKQQYNVDTREAQEQLQKLIDKTKDSADKTTQAISQMYQNQLDSIKNFTKEGIIELGDAFNTEQSGIASANTAYESFQKSIEGGDLYTGISENMAKIYEEIQDGVDNQGNGSAGWWKGAKMLLGEGNIKGKSFDQVNKKLLAIKDTLKEGQDGTDAFFKHLSDGAMQNKDLPEKIFGKNTKISKYFKTNADGSVDVNIPFEAGSEQFEALAEAVGMSSDLLIAQLNKSKQFSDISFTDMGEVRKAIATSDSTVLGTKSDTVNGYRTAWTRESTFREEAENANLRPPEIEKAVTDAAKKGIKFLKDPDDIKKADMQEYVKSWTGENQISTRKLIESFDKAGYSEEEIRQIYDNFGEDVITQKSLNNDDFNTVYDSIKAGESEATDSIKNSSQETADNTGQLVNLMGGFTQEQQQEAQTYTDQANDNSSTLNQFKLGEIDGSKITSQSQYNSTLNTLQTDYENLQTLKAEAEAALQKDPTNQALIEQVDALAQAEEKYKTAIENGKAAWANLKASMKIDNGDDAVQTAQNTVKNARSAGYNDTEIKDLGTQFVSTNQSALAGLSPEKFAEVMSQFGILKKEAAALRQQFNMPFAFKVLGQEKLTKYIENVKGITKGQKSIYLSTKLTGQEKVNKIVDNLSELGFKGASQRVKKDLIIQAATKYAEGDKEGANDLLAGATDKNGNAIFGKGAITTITKNFEVMASGKIANQDDFIGGLQSDVEGAAKEAGVTIKAKATVDSAKVTEGAKSEAKEEADVDGATITYDNANLTGGAKPSDQTATVNYKLGKQDKPKSKDATVNYTNIGSQAKPTPQSTTVNYTASVGKSGKSSQKFTLTIAKAARGMNNTIRRSIVPTIGSLAKGTKSYQKKTQFGRVGPNGKGGATLTGEEGYEIGWIPSENRAMILGADGPQVTNLPKEAVVWTHEQSKKILKQKSIPLGSHAANGKYRPKPDGSGGTGGTGRIGGKGRTGGNGGSDGSNGSGSDDSNNDKHLIKINRFLKHRGKLTVYVWNMERKIEAVQRKIEALQNKINKQLEKTSITLKDISSTSNKEISKLRQSVKLNKQLQSYYRRQLRNLSGANDRKGKTKSKRTISWEQPTRKYTFKSGVSKKDAKRYARILSDPDRYSKKERNRIKKKYVKKTEKGSKNRTERIALNRFIDYDPATGAYVVNQKAINKAAGKNKARAKAIRDKAQELIEKNTTGRNQAADNITEAKNKLDELTQQLYDTFYGWENELTKILHLTTRINKISGDKERAGGLANLYESRIGSGMQDLTNTLLKNSFNAFKQEQQLALRELKARQNAIKEQQKVIQNLITPFKKGSAKNAELKNVKKRLKQNTLFETKADKKKAQNDKKKAQKALKQANKVLNDKNATKAEKNRARKQKKEAQKRIKRDNARIKKDNKTIKSLNKQGIKGKGKNLSNTNEEILKKRRKELKEQRKNTKIAQKYVTTKTLADGTVVTTLNSSKLEKDRKSGKISEKLYNFIKDYYDKINDANDELMDMYNSQVEILDGMYSSLRDLQDRYAERSEELLDAVENDAEQNIEKLEKLNDSLTNALKDLLDEVKKRLDQRRQQEENLKTEQDIASKQQRLAALRADSAGGNAKEIRQLEKELAEAQKSYERSLEDQALKRLQDQADEAQKQREKQIKLLQNQLEVSKTNGELIAMVNQLLLNPEANKDEIQEMWRRAQDYYNKTDARKVTLDNDWNEFWADIQLDTGLPAKIEEQKDAIKEAEATLNKTLNKIHQTLRAMAGESGQWIIEHRQSQGRGMGANTNTNSNQSSLSAGRWAQKEIQNAGGTYNVKDWYKDASEAGLSAEEARAGAAGMTTDVKGKNGKVVSGHVTSAGNRTIARSGSQLYTNVLDDKGNVVSQSQNNIYNMTEKQARTWQSYDSNAFKNAVLYAIRNSTPGKKLNKNGKFGKIAEIAGVKLGSTHKLKNGWTGSLGKGGKLAYDNNFGVSVWDMNKGTLKLEPPAPLIKGKEYKVINKYKEKAKSYPYTGREYAQFIYKNTPITKAILKKWGITKFATGGLATTTGPAWLDGTKSKPELVLNAQDTSNFLALKDVLAKAVSGSKSINNTDNANYDIDIHVDQLANDYDVDKMVERVKKQITKDAGYRNVNEVRHMR